MVSPISVAPMATENRMHLFIPGRYQGFSLFSGGIPRSCSTARPRSPIPLKPEAKWTADEFWDTLIREVIGRTLVEVRDVLDP